MLWSIVKILCFLALVVAATFGASHLIGLEGGVQIVMSGQEFNLSPIKAVVGLLLLILAVWLVIKLMQFLFALLHFINGDETALTRYFSRNRERKGYRALSDGILALASGEGAAAMSHAQKAEKYLKKPALTNLITAQAADMSGNSRKAEEAYKKLIKNEKTRFVGIRGIMQKKLEQGDTETAMQLAQKAFALKPRNVEMQDTLLKLQADKQDWKGARQTLNSKLKYGSLPKDVHRRRDAIFALSQASEYLDDNKIVEAREAAIEANRLSPDLIPAAIMAARSYLQSGSVRNASRVIQRAWKVQPHPELAAVYAEIQPDETPQLRLRRFRKLMKMHPEHRESRLLEAELNIAAEDFPTARRAVKPLLDTDPDARALTIMAAVERGEGASDTIVKGWLARAVMAPRGPQWICSSCQHMHADWAPICEHCNSFDTLSWTALPPAKTTSPTGVGMLPLIVGGTDEAAEDGTSEDADTAAPAAAEEGATESTSDTNIDAEVIEMSAPTDTDDAKK